jgi:hypothetical protein
MCTSLERWIGAWTLKQEAATEAYARIEAGVCARHAARSNSIFVVGKTFSMVCGDSSVKIVAGLPGNDKPDRETDEN